MAQIRNFAQLLEGALQCENKRVAIVGAGQRETLHAVRMAHGLGLAECILIDDPRRLDQVASEEGIDLDGMPIINESDMVQAAYKAVSMIHADEADMVMNGRALPVELMKAALDAGKGLRIGKLISDVSVFEIPDFDRLILVSDVAIIVSPNLAQKVAIVQNAIDTAIELGIERPKVAILAATEMVNPEMPANMDAANLSKMSERGQIRGGLVDGPLAMDNAISAKAAEMKGIKSEVAGHADILITPNVESGNILAKAISYFARGHMAAVVVGAKCPIVMPSRSDPPEQKMLSLALGVYLTKSRSGK
ncbi:MAG: bifunctional enoyl-CoA hydratase/phosphate acetyltransferase [Anaerolineae bacterium]|nr:bifunctional enoyl-CoA hydratase/phosphate acetyltransferase [Anaerolineae bacterium]